MRDYDEMIARMTEADGVRMASGQHIDTSPIPRHDTTLLDAPWHSHQCVVTSEHALCPLLYTDGRICACKCHTRPVEMAFIDRELPDHVGNCPAWNGEACECEVGWHAEEYGDDDDEAGCWYDGQGSCIVHPHPNNDLPEPADEDPWIDRHDHYDR
jgi:hypothetical protein